MKIVLAPDSFKGTLTSREVCAIEAQAIHEVLPSAQVIQVPLADGGEGTLEAVAYALPAAQWFTAPCHDPLGRPITGKYLMLPDGKTAVVELAQASGLHLLSPEERNPRFATTFGTGEILWQVLERGVRNIIIGLGGSATVDGGCGIAAALGITFFDSSGQPLEAMTLPVPDFLARARTYNYNTTHGPGHYERIQLTIASDVTNPLLGPDGAAAVFGPQKGATPELVQQLEAALTQWTKLWNDRGLQFGDGAAGGAGFLLRKLFANCQKRSGGEVVCNLAKLEQQMAGADLVITGEGASDRQTLAGKLPLVVSRYARNASAPCALLAGLLSPEARPALQPHFNLLASTTDTPIPLGELTPEACRKRLEQATRKLILTILDKSWQL